MKIKQLSLNSLIKRPDLPIWFTTLNYIVVLPIGYPLILFTNMLTSFWLYKKQKHIAMFYTIFLKQVRSSIK